MSAFNSMQAPSPATNYVASSGNQYVSTNTIPGIIFNVLAGDIASLQTFGCVLLLPRNQFDSGRSPTNSDDFTAGYGVGSLWTEVAGGIFTEFGCVSMGVTAGTASWIQLTTTSPTSPVISNIGSATYTVAATDSGKVLNINGGIFQAITFPAAATLGSGFYCTVQNGESTLIGKGIAGIWIQSFTLYPGQSFQVINNSGTLELVDAGLAQTSITPKRYRNNAIQLYVSNTGSDSPTVADGLSVSRPFLTLGHGLKVLYDAFDHASAQPVINVAAGTYNESITIAGRLVGANVFFLEGAGITTVWKPASSSTPYCVIVADGAVLEISGIYFDATSVTGVTTLIQLHNRIICDLNANLGFGNAQQPSGTHIGTDGNGSTTGFNDSYQIGIASPVGAGTHLNIASGCMFVQAGGITVTLNGSPGPAFTTFYKAADGGIINIGGGATYSGALSVGAQQWNVGPMAFLSTGGNTIPGSVAGAPTLSAAPTGASGWVTV